MWYAASEIVFFIVVAAVIGGLVGYGVGQIYQLDFGDLRSALASRRGQTEALAEARVEIADLRRKLDLMTEALRGDTAVTDDGNRSGADARNVDDPSAGHVDVIDDAGFDGRRLSERVADAERS
jgi:hypothetical protein